MSGQDTATDAIRARYIALFGNVPENIERRIQLAQRSEHSAAIEAVEHFREVLLHQNPLDTKTQQLVHLGMLLALGEEGPAHLHVRGARRAGATVAELFGVCETAAVVCGMPGFSRAVDVVTAALAEESGLAEDSGLASGP